MKHDPLDAAGLALCWWDVSFQFAYYNSAKKQRQRSSCFLDNVRGALLSGILASDRFVYERSWPTADVRICIRHQRGTLTTRLWEKLTDGGCTHPSSTRYSDEMRFGTVTLHSDNGTDTSLFPRLLRSNSRPRWFNGCGRFDGATIRADVLDTIRPEVSASARRLDDVIDECYDNEMSEKATMQIGR